MIFYLSSSDNFNKSDKRNIISLVLSGWDDWFTYSTLYSVYYYNENSVRSHLGTVKIGQKDMAVGQRTPKLPDEFQQLPDEFFSLGQDVSYYEMLNSYGEEYRETILNALNDIALKNAIYEEAIKENVTKVSLLRSVSPTSVEGQFRRLAQGIVELTPYNFKFIAPKHSKSVFSPMVLEFNVTPNSNPPSNIHVIIGRNGVGKTHLFNNMISSLIEDNSTRSKHGQFKSLNNYNEKIFANLVSVSFSAFDETSPIAEKRDKVKNINYSYIGLKRLARATEKLLPKSPTVLKNEFVKSVEKCRLGAKNERWLKALEMLEADPIFHEAEVSRIAKLDLDEEFEQLSANIFNKLSSGHKIVLLTITRLVESVEERSLVLIDEPEGYLHPPLLSAFIRALSDLLIKRNAVAIVCTHSPVVLQEVPKRCVWKLRRNAANAVAERLDIESFGENVGLLTQEVFGLEVTDSGFHKILKKVVEETSTYDEAINEFHNEIGLEGKAILRNLFHHKSISGEKNR